MAKQQKRTRNHLTFVNERNITILLAVILAACLVVLFVRDTNQTTYITDPLILEQAEQEK